MTELAAGPLTLRYAAGELRELRIAGREVIRRVYTVFQDVNWTNRAWVVREEHIEVNEDSFAITCLTTSSTAPFDVTIRISGSANGTITYDIRGVATAAFARNRLGICVLHPIDGVAGAPVAITHTDGSVERARFPESISPHQPFLDVAAMATDETTVEFSGEVFETEDHRNWSDASFKTYCTPIALPFPVELRAGDVVEQSVTVRAHAVNVPIARRVACELRIDDRVLPLPRIGVGLSLPDSVAGPFPYFTELNRDRNAITGHDVVVFGLTPQVHFHDDESIVLNLVTQEIVARNARALVGDRELWVHSVTLRPLTNPNATGPEPDFTNVDARQDTWLGEAWTALSIKYLTQAESVDVVSYYDHDRVAGTPTERLFTEIASATGMQSVTASRPEVVDALALVQDGGLLLVIANFSHETQDATLTGVLRDTITLPPTSVSRVWKER